MIIVIVMKLGEAPAKVKVKVNPKDDDLCYLKNNTNYYLKNHLQ